MEQGEPVLRLVRRRPQRGRHEGGRRRGQDSQGRGLQVRRGAHQRAQAGPDHAQVRAANERLGTIAFTFKYGNLLDNLAYLVHLDLFWI